MSNATQGIYLERRAAEILSSRGWFTIRAAGSHGVADVVAIRAGQVVLVQCKTNGEVGGAEWNRLHDVARNIGALAIVAQYDTVSHRRIIFMEITGPHRDRSRSWPHQPWQPVVVRPDGLTMTAATAARVADLELERLNITPRAT